ncbi:DUF4190 domain-containing protein [Streptomyces sp. SCSIO 30461]|uniref:DUF4190 domain-containing protein n=1 Tax=Streptomyces sp. SCSIO 30461 TaxID=3118085 RepID=UPI0030D5B3CB
MQEQSDRPPAGHTPSDPWAPPEHSASQGGRGQSGGVELGKSTAPASPTVPDVQDTPPAGRGVHDQPTLTSVPDTETGTGPADPPPAGTGAVPPPPVAPGGPAQAAPGAYGYPAAQGPVTSAYGYPGYPVSSGHPGYPGHTGSWGVTAQPQNGFGTTAMVLGIISVCGFFCYGIPGLVLGVLALIFGILGRKRYVRGQATNKGQALAGIILGSVGIVLGAAFFAFMVWLFANHEGWDEERYDSGVDDDPWATTLVVSDPRR